jgi:hypothetical protein
MRISPSDTAVPCRSEIRDLGDPIDLPGERLQIATTAQLDVIGDPRRDGRIADEIPVDGHAYGTELDPEARRLAEQVVRGTPGDRNVGAGRR